MHDFKYRKGQLFCEDVRVSDIAREVDTPFFLYSRKTLLEHYQKLKKAFSAIEPVICFSVKANSNLAVLRILVKEGAGLDIVSGGELYRAKKVGADPKKIVFAGVGKRCDELDLCLKWNIFFINVESIEELELLNERAGFLRKNPNVALRLNPDIEARTHRYITTGTKYNKFGIDFNTARWLFLNSDRFPNLRLRGVHIHIGSQIVGSRPFLRAIRRVADFTIGLRNIGVKLEYLNIGGGLGIIYKNERPQTADEYAKAVLPILKASGLKIIMEPGRFICGNAGILVSKVTYIKRTKVRNFIVLDAGMNDLLRPALYGAYHNILPVESDPETCSKGASRFDVVGPICESGDFFGYNRNLPVDQGGLVAIMSAGAYGFTMSSNYNSRPRCCEVLVSGDRYYVVRKRESYADLIKGESIPSILR